MKTRALLAGLSFAALTVAAAPIATLGYLGLIAAVSRPPGPVMAKAQAATAID